MYKLLTTTAIVLAVATPSLAWDNAENLTKKLETIYGSLDGQTQFDALQSGTGELANFFGEVDKGVTYVTLTVDPKTNNITTGINEGSTFAEITVKKDDLVNRINYDLFAQNTTTEATYDAGKDYVTLDAFTIDGTPENTADNDYTGSHTDGLAGAKITKLVDNVNKANDYLVDVNRSNTESQAFITAWNDTGVGKFGVGDAQTDIAVINSDVDDLNTAINTASNFVLDAEGNWVSGTAFANLGDTGIFSNGVLDTNINSFLIPSFTDAGNIGNAGEGNFTSISDWANDVQTIDVAGTLYNFAGTASLEVVDADNVLVGGVSTPITDAAFTPVPLP